MSGDLLQMKLHVPQRRPSLVPRPHLIKKLNQGIRQGSKLTLTSAPAGFGKTTLVAEWLLQEERPLGWLSLDEEDNDPQRFFIYLVTALQSLADGVELTLPSPNLPIKAMTTLLVNNLMQLPRPVVLVLDDYHLCHPIAPCLWWDSSLHYGLFGGSSCPICTNKLPTGLPNTALYMRPSKWP